LTAHAQFYFDAVFYNIETVKLQQAIEQKIAAALII
jgi:hypothetical protein|tara:strand:- start:51480 stop:51587 length:108 start_codon:yes stop_codon:yes gene_type:complete